ncbi:MAG TPA: tetratricopeptide repeat protein [Candidatus Krumholzibacteria bacterium]|nr:tetratricopeptide repeat protein [Candidatus Krumholzibacteria bacterium]
MTSHSHFRRAQAVALLAAAFATACASSAKQQSAAANAELNATKRRASLQIRAGEYAEAVKSLETVVRQAPKDDQAYTMLGDAYRGLGDFAHAVKSYEQAMRINYGDYQPHLKLGILLMEHGKTGRALTEFEEAMKFGADDPLVHYNYALALHELGRSKEALEHWRVARDTEPDNPVFVTGVGIGLVGVDDQEAVKQFARAGEMGLQKDGLYYNNYALALERVGNNAEAETNFRSAIALADAKQKEYRRNLARHYLRAGKSEDAAREFEQLVQEDGGKWSDTVYAARALVEVARFDDALARLSDLADAVASGKVARSDPRIDRMPPSLGEALSVVGMAWRGKGDLARSRDYLRRAAAQAPDDPAVLNNYGVVLAESGMLPDAKAQWRRVLEIDPANATAKANLSASGQ